MAVTEYLYILVGVLFFCVFIFFAGSASDYLFELYSPAQKPNKPPSKQKKEETINTTVNVNGISFVPSKVNTIYEKTKENIDNPNNIKSIENEDDEKKEYEDNTYNNTPDIINVAKIATNDINNEMKENTGNISPLSDHDTNKNESKNPLDYPNKNGTYATDNTTTLAYFLELQSRLQHLQSLLGTDINENTFHSVNTYYNSDNKQDDKPVDIVTELHSNNMKLIESVIQNVIYDKSHDNVMEADRDFYNKLNNDNTDTNWSRSMTNKRRPSIEQKIYRNIDYSLGYILEMGMKLMGNSNVVNLVTSAAVLYSCGVLYYCNENGVSVSLFAYVFGIVLVFMVMGIGYFFNISSIKRNGNEFIIAMVLSGVLIYFALFWISYYFNVTAAFILIMAIVLSYQYKHGPIYAKQRNFDEIWVCLLLNCGLPLFAYYLQLPEIQKLQQLQPQLQQSVLNHINASVIEQVKIESIITETSVTEPQSWLMYIFDIIYYILAWIINDFWNMMDITYALDEPETIQQQEQPQDVQSTENVIQQNETETISSSEEQSNMIDGIDGIDGIDDTLYWFNKLFYMFPYTLFNIILISWFITHSSMLIRNVSLYKTVNTKLLYCVEIILAYVLSIIFWYNNMFDITFFYCMIVTIPWTIGLLRHIWEHQNIQNDQQISRHTEIFNLWFFVSIYLSFVYNWIYQNGIFFSIFSPNLLIVVAPFYFIIQSMPQIVDEFVWATDF